MVAAWCDGVLLDRLKNDPKLEAIGGGDSEVAFPAPVSTCEFSGNVPEGAEPLLLRKDENRLMRGRDEDESAWTSTE